jgi:hypothetical protein
MKVKGSYLREAKVPRVMRTLPKRGHGAMRNEIPTYKRLASHEG